MLMYMYMYILDTHPDDKAPVLSLPQCVCARGRVSVLDRPPGITVCEPPPMYIQYTVKEALRLMQSQVLDSDASTSPDRERSVSPGPQALKIAIGSRTALSFL